MQYEQTIMNGLGLWSRGVIDDRGQRHVIVVVGTGYYRVPRGPMFRSYACEVDGKIGEITHHESVAEAFEAGIQRIERDSAGMATV